MSRKSFIGPILFGTLIGTLALLIKNGIFEDKSVTYDEIGDAIKDLDD